MITLEGRVLIKNEPCFEDLINILLHNDYDLHIYKTDNNLLDINYIKREVEF